MTLMALIPARGGSKRIPGKNLALLEGKPLILWSLDALRRSGLACEIVISTDSEDIAKVCREYGFAVEWLRPAELSDDSASSVDVALHALEYYEKLGINFDELILLQPTSPLRSPESILGAYETFKEGGDNPLVSVSPVKDHPMWAVKIIEGRGVAFTESNGFMMRSQELPKAYSLNGSIYITKTIDLKKNLTFVPEFFTPYIIMSNVESIDIDDPEDLGFANYLLQAATPQV
jgi:CMP-N,N'-diacetyllegionaminic acid synthase